MPAPPDAKPPLAALLLSEAVKYAAERGWPVFPLVPGTKRPLTEHGFKDATTDLEQIRRWWSATPDANIGIPTGRPETFTVLDVDIKPRESKRGDLSLQALTDKHGPLPADTPSQRTWSGGRQYFFAPRAGVKNSASQLGKGLDIRGEGGYVVVPPGFVEEDGRSGAYSWAVPPLDALPAMPDWLVEAAESPKSGNAAGWELPLLDGVEHGRRNDTCTKLIGRWCTKGLNKEEVLLLALSWAEKCSPPVPPGTVHGIVDRIFAKELEKYTAMLGGAGLDGTEETEASHGHTHDGSTIMGYPLTDAGNAERLIFLYGNRFRWLTDTEEWLAWDGKRWAEGSEDVVRRLVLKTARSLQATAVKFAEKWRPEWEPRERVMKHALALESIRNVNGALASARYMTAVQAKRTDFDQDPDVLNVGNGTLDLRTFQLRPHTPGDHISRVIPIAYDPQATAPRWEQFLRDVFLDQDAVIRYVQRAIGYSLTGSLAEQCFFMEHGAGENGKSTFKDTLAALFGEYGVKLDQEAILADERGRGSRATPERMVLIGKRFAYVDEMEEGRDIDEARIKALTGSATDTGRALYKGMDEWANTAKLWFDLNTLPKFKGVDDGIARRPRIIPFDWRVPGEKKVKDFFVAVLRAELPGILAWAVAGCRAWRAEGLAAPEGVSMATRAYVEENNHLPVFFAECLERGQPGERVDAATVKAVYESWCQGAGQAQKDYQRKVAPYLRGPCRLTPGRATGGTRFWEPLRLRCATGVTSSDANPQSLSLSLSHGGVWGKASLGVTDPGGEVKTVSNGQIAHESRPPLDPALNPDDPANDLDPGATLRPAGGCTS